MEFLFSGFADEAGTTIEEQMDVFEKNGFKYIEMRGVDGKHVLEWDETSLAAIKEKMDKRGFALSAIGSPVGKYKITEPFENDLKRFKQAVHCAKFFGCKYIRAFSFFPPEDGNRSGYWDEVIRRVKEMVSIAEENNLVYALENESGIFTDTLDYCVKIFDEITSPAFGLAFDPGNFVRNGVKPIDAYKALKEKVVYFHIKDAAGDKFVPSGEGESKITELLKEAYDGGFNGFLSVEPHLGYLKDLTKAQQFTTACNSLKKSLNEGMKTNFPLIDLSTV